MRKNRIRAKINKPKRHNKLQSHIEERHLHMPNLQLIRHQLVRMLPMRLPQILMQHNPVTDSQHTIHPIHQEEDQVRHIPRLHNQLPDSKQHDKRNTDTTHIPGKALRLTLRAEVKEAEHQYTQYRYNQIRFINKPFRTIHQQQRHQHSKRISRRDTIDTTHKVDDVRSPHTYNESP